MKSKICPTCKRPMALDEVAEGLRGVKRKIYELVAQSGADGIDRTRIMEKAYEDLPERDHKSDNIIKAHIWQINKRLFCHGFRIVSYRQARGELGLYRLELRDGPLR